MHAVAGARASHNRMVSSLALAVGSEAPWKHKTQGLDGVLFLPCPSSHDRYQQAVAAGRASVLA